MHCDGAPHLARSTSTCVNRARRANKKCHHSQTKKTKGGQHEHRVWVSKEDILPDVHLPRVDLVEGIKVAHEHGLVRR